jgi:cytochrome P450
VSNAIVNMIYILAKYPEYIKEARKEINELLGKEDPKFEDLKDLVLCDCIVKETLRLFPSAIQVLFFKKHFLF